LAVVVFFSLSQSKLPGYILTAVVALGVLIARLFVEAARAGGAGPWCAVVRRGSLAFGITATLAATLGLLPMLAPEILNALPARTAAYLRDLTSAFLQLGCLSAASAVIAFAGYYRRDVRVVGAAFLLYAVALVPILSAHMGRYAEHRAASSLARRLPVLSEDTILACYRCYPNGLSFYAKRYVTVITASDGYELQSNYIRFALSSEPTWPESIVRESDLARWLTARDRRPIFLLVKPGDVGSLRARLGSREVAVAPLTPEFSGTLLLPRRDH
jgi:4-amino-4-deoxy-L-arabinose transferase-like glycosyltransferase